MNNVSDQEFNPTPEGKWSNICYLIRKIISEAIQKHSNKLSGRILDYGCGSMPYKRFFYSSEYVGVDIEVSGHPEEMKKADVYFDGINLPFDDSSFDGVLASEVFEHVFDLKACLKEIHRVLKPGGKMLVTCPFVWPLHEQPYDYARYTPHALEHLFKGAGFNILVSEKGGTPIEVIGQMIIYEILPVALGGMRLPGRIARPASRFLQGTIAGASTFLSRFSRFSPPQDARRLYLTNTVVVEKPATDLP